jgi:hypothetical protein
MAGIKEECESGDRDLALGEPMGALADGPPRSQIKLLRMVTQESTDGARASLCIFAPDEVDGTSDLASGREPLPRVRYTLAYRVNDAATSVTTVVSPSTTGLAEMFPAEGDAPGSDLAAIARPERARRTLTALVGTNDHSVRVYESPLSTEAAAQSYDAAMTGLGYATTASLADARMYRRDGRSVAVSFKATTEGCAIAIAPFERGKEAETHPSPRPTTP